ncbi:2508_t:CDS:2, partial [Funneliformis mosseae]
AADYANLIPNHIIKLIPRADHNYSDQHETLIKTINKYFSDDFQYMKFNDKYLYRIPRYIFIGGVKNFRDLGGYECNLGEQNNRIQQFVRERFVFRCGNLTSITNDGIATLRKLNIQKIFDLRSNPEVNKMGIKNIEGIIRVHAPVFKEEDYSPEKLFERWNLNIKDVEGYSKVYMTILEEGKKAYYEIFKHILEHQAQPFIVHCTAGKDRTGVFAMLLLKLLGVNYEIISREYELTQIIKDPQKIKFISKTMNNKYEDDGIKEMLNAKYESMILFLRKFQNHYNTVDNYLLQCGFTKEDIEIIKNNLFLHPASLSPLQNNPYLNNSITKDFLAPIVAAPFLIHLSNLFYLENRFE